MLDLPLSFLHRPAASGTVAARLLVLLHGVGSNESDMFSLAPLVPDDFHVLALRGPLSMGPQAHAWFAVQFTSQGPVINPAQEAASRALLAECIPEAAKQLGVPAQRVVVGGFNQGGIMSVSLLLTQPQLLQAAMAMHSRLLPEVAPLTAEATAFTGKQLWVSLGLQDQVVAPGGAQAIRTHAAKLPLALSFNEYPGGHELRPAEVQQAMAWLAALP